MGTVRLRDSDEKWIRQFKEGTMHECIEEIRKRLEPEKLNTNEFQILTNRAIKIEKRLEELEGTVNERTGEY